MDKDLKEKMIAAAFTGISVFIVDRAFAIYHKDQEMKTLAEMIVAENKALSVLKRTEAKKTRTAVRKAPGSDRERGEERLEKELMAVKSEILALKLKLFVDLNKTQSIEVKDAAKVVPALQDVRQLLYKHRDVK